MDNNKEKLELKEEFELREKRVNLMYKVLYVAAAIWISLMNFVAKKQVDASSASIFVFLLSLITAISVEILQYAFFELRCMKIKERASEEMSEKAEKLYDNIWKNFGEQFFMLLFIMFFHIYFVKFLTLNISVITFSALTFISTISYMIKSTHENSKLAKEVFLFVLLLTVYFFYLFMCLAVIQNA